jgi:hypothetical protein
METKTATRVVNMIKKQIQLKKKNMEYSPHDDVWKTWWRLENVSKRGISWKFLTCKWDGQLFHVRWNDLIDKKIQNLLNERRQQDNKRSKSEDEFTTSDEMPLRLLIDIIDASPIECWELSTAQAGASDVRDVAFIHYPSCTDSIKPSLQFSRNFVVIMRQRDHFVSRFLYFTTAGVKCCVAAVLHFSVVIFFWSFGIIDVITIECWELSTAQASASEFTTSDEMPLKLLIEIIEKHSDHKKQSDPSESLIRT